MDKFKYVHKWMKFTQNSQIEMQCPLLLSSPNLPSEFNQYSRGLIWSSNQSVCPLSNNKSFAYQRVHSIIDTRDLFCPVTHLNPSCPTVTSLQPQGFFSTSIHPHSLVYPAKNPQTKALNATTYPHGLVRPTVSPRAHAPLERHDHISIQFI